jgi:ferredoxin
VHLRDLLAEMGGKVPIVDPERCVHARLEVATCQRCVSVCPVDAWLLDDEQLALDTDRCDGCGLCVADCPEGAIALPALALPDHEGETEIRIACGKTTFDRRDWRLPCIHALGLRQLSRLYATGLRRITLSNTACQDCPNDGVAGFTDRIAAMNRVFSQRGVPTIELRGGAAGGYTTEESPVHLAKDGANLSRRGFLFGLLHDSIEQRSPDVPPTIDLPGACLPPIGKSDLAFHTPQIDPTRCNGCDACLQVCVHRALTLSSSEDAYLLDPNRCTGCNVCSDVCDQQAVAVTDYGSARQLRIPLHSRRCAACGADFHRPNLIKDTPPTHCHICSTKNHHRHLYQVL